MLPANEKLKVEEILKDLEHYSPKRRGWTWRKRLPKGAKVDGFNYDEISEPLTNSIGLPASHYFDNIDPQPDSVITSEIASGRFEDDIRRMRMAAWHGADHIMVIRTLGQSHIDGLIEGTPEGIGGIPITRKQLRATRKALDIIEEEVGRPINFHSYVSGVAGPEIAVLFAEEGVNGAHQDPQYNILYRGINPVRSFVDAAVAKRIMASVDMLQIDGAHNANASAKRAWKVMPELLVQHAINCAFSVKAGMKKGSIALSTVPPVVSPAPEFKLNFVYALTLRELFKEYRFRAQMNTRYIESDLIDATRIHVLDTLISRLTRADIQSTITPDEGRNVPWHINSIRGVETAKHTLLALDGIKDLLKVNEEVVRPKIREMKMRAILMMEEILEVGGYFEAVEKGFFVDNGQYPERNGDGIARQKNGGIGAGSVVPRDPEYFAPVSEHFGYNNIPEGFSSPDEPIGGCTLQDRSKIKYIDELDESDNVNLRISQQLLDREKGLISPEVEWWGDGWIQLDMTIPDDPDHSEAAALEIAKRMGFTDASVISKTVLHPVEGTYLELKAKVPFKIERDSLKLPEKPDLLSEEEITSFVQEHPMRVVAGTVGNDEHSVGIREILDIKHGGIEKFGFKYTYLGTSVSPEKFIDAAVETGAEAILVSTIITHNEVHVSNMTKIAQLAVEKGVRNKVIIISGGTQITNDLAVACGMDAGFGRGTKGINVASFLVKKKRALLG
ncbi:MULTISPECIES: D-ornithine 4,5-aminomutase subunit OraE [unclassified Mesotoga]|uniref:D-ornithine 4,5-aminomutase subunit OraE n=1 Tax=unclassified Mesotoga TaxID=1184398 RepID=UPI000EF25B1D|nr:MULTISPECIES: D-ornithine 4,5-aminomutase subunit OraE [unclassified Mesotoga]MDD4207348.1 D-ornithine 4,5-aminomutase subunit OraE [Mesotoga sp.]MDD4825188.1 D-ornithine 4,5-aminomutase subunit OraE [Mesotoga sp.]MDD5682445.1 D-ornithine 4,5-aminomutase subunit OraE [Mesotoga sp.]RLL85597.1 LuxR family transcriptional regulator [Mesotoga sp. BH458_6_3_2_1]